MNTDQATKALWQANDSPTGARASCGRRLDPTRTTRWLEASAPVWCRPQGPARGDARPTTLLPQWWPGAKHLIAAQSSQHFIQPVSERLHFGLRARRIAQWVCAQAGGSFTPHPPAPALPKVLLPAVCAVEQKIIATLQSLVEASAKGELTPAEMAVIRSRWEEQNAAMEGFLQGIFRCGALLLTLDWLLPPTAAPVLA